MEIQDLVSQQEDEIKEESKSGNASNIYETSYSKYLQHQNIESGRQSLSP